MMNIFLIIAIVVTNIIAVTIVYQILKKQPKKEILIFIAAGVTILYLVVSLIYWLSGFGISEQVHESTKNFVIYLFVPVNVILFMPYAAIQYKKIRQNKKIEKYDIEKLSTKIAVVLTIFIVVSIGEFFYFKNIQNNINIIKEDNKKSSQVPITIKSVNETNNGTLENTTKNVVENTNANNFNTITNENMVEKTNQIRN